MLQSSLADIASAKAAGIVTSLKRHWAAMKDKRGGLEKALDQLRTQASMDSVEGQAAREAYVRAKVPDDAEQPAPDPDAWKVSTAPCHRSS
jgi:hypothetical protein